MTVIPIVTELTYVLGNFHRPHLPILKAAVLGGVMFGTCSLQRRVQFRVHVYHLIVLARSNNGSDGEIRGRVELAYPFYLRFHCCSGRDDCCILVLLFGKATQRYIEKVC